MPATQTVAPKPVETSTPPIPIDEALKRGLLGELGAPFGTLITIEGTAVEGSTLRYKAADGETFIQVESVGGSRLKTPVLTHWVAHQLAKIEIKPPKHGTHVRYRGYEMGRFEGIVDEAENYIRVHAENRGFGFSTVFIAVKEFKE